MSGRSGRSFTGRKETGGGLAVEDSVPAGGQFGRGEGGEEGVPVPHLPYLRQCRAVVRRVGRAGRRDGGGAAHHHGRVQGDAREGADEFTFRHESGGQFDQPGGGPARLAWK